MPTDPDLRDADLRTLFRDAPAPTSSIDAAATIRRSKRRRLPQQLGAGSVLTLAVAGIGVASFSGLQGLSPSATTADAPMGVAESGPFAGADSTASEESASCATDSATDGVADADDAVEDGLELTSRFPDTASVGQAVTGALTLTNTGTEPVTGIAQAPIVTLSRGGEVVRHRDLSSTDTKVALAPGESVTFAFSLDPVDCNAEGDATRAALEPGEYMLSAVLELQPEDGPVRVAGAPASVIVLR